MESSGESGYRKGQTSTAKEKFVMPSSRSLKSREDDAQVGSWLRAGRDVGITAKMRHLRSVVYFLCSVSCKGRVPQPSRILSA